MDIILSEDESQKQVVAECRLPFSFNVVPKIWVTHGKRNSAQVKQEGDFPTPEACAVRPRMDGPNVTAQIHPLGNDPIHHPAQLRPPRYDQIHHPAQDIDRQGASEVVQSWEDSKFSGNPLASPAPAPQTGDLSSTSLEVTNRPNQVIVLPRTDGECEPTLTHVNPESGSTTGGTVIWLAGIDFPVRFPVFARFGTSVVRTVS